MSDFSSVLQSAGVGALSSVYDSLSQNQDPWSAGGAAPPGGYTLPAGTSSTIVAAAPTTNWGELALIGGLALAGIVVVVIILKKA